MRLAASLLGASLIAAPPAGAAQAGGAPPATPLKVYGRLPTLEDVALSPDGKRIAFVRGVDEERSLIVRQSASPEVLIMVRIGDADLRRVEWLDNDDLLSTVYSTSRPPADFAGPRTEWCLLLHHRVSNGATSRLDFRIYGERTLEVTRCAPITRRAGAAVTVFIPGLYVANRTLPGLFKYEVASGRMQLIAKSTEPWTQWLVDESGRIGGEFLYHDDTQVWELMARRDDRLAAVATGHEALDVPKVVGFSANGDAIVLEFIENGAPVWRPFELEKMDWGAPMSEGAEFSEAIVDHMSGRIVGGIRGFDDDRYVFFNQEMQALWDTVLQAFPDEQVRLVSASDGFGAVIVRVFGERDGYVYAVFNRRSHRTSIFGKVYEGLQEVFEVKPITYPAGDGLPIPAYLTLPRDRAPKNLALIVLPHGGPASADSVKFDWWAQALAAQGYAVLQPNYRGSALNYRFIAAGFGQWGRKMQTDLSDGVRYLAGQGLIDPNRVCIVGASYGGYAALAGVTIDPGVYRCAVSVAGISDIERLFRWVGTNAQGSESYTQRYWDRFMGLRGPGDPKLKEISPIEHIGAVSAPVLLIHGRDDTVVPYEQSAAMADALKHAGKPVQLVTLRREDHWLSRSATRLEMLKATVNFLKTNNPP